MMNKPVTRINSSVYELKDIIERLEKMEVNMTTMEDTF